MEKTLFKFIWKYSKKEQFVLLIVTVLTFPILYLSLELPKRIINDAINGTAEIYHFAGFSLSQTQFLLVLCLGFLLAVLVNGLLKMRLNTMKGILAERLLRRFRYQMLARIHRFPRSYFRSTSQGELVSMVTSEAEPMGGLMGDALAQPVFQAGQMLTILIFLFAQSVWFGLASVAVIPLQAWLIPKLQRQINQLNKSRIHEVRRLAADIGESANGVSDIRINGGLRHRMALFSKRLGNLYYLRFEIFQKKFFMKFLNNFLAQLTPFFFYSVGGYLAIKGEITVGALVAALAAYKDLSPPWRELLTYYNQTQDMSLRWKIVLDKFVPDILADDNLFEGKPARATELKGDIEITNVTVRDEADHIILEDISLKIPHRARVAVKTVNESAALAFADLITREVLPARGKVTIAGHDLNSLHQSVIAKSIGYAHSRPQLLEGSLGDNLFMPFKTEPLTNAVEDSSIGKHHDDALRSGNSTDFYDTEWTDPSVVGMQSSDEIREWWFQLVVAMGIDDFMVRRALHSRIDASGHLELVDAVVKLRPEIERRISEAGLEDTVHRFHPDKFNPVSPLGSNLLFASPTRELTQLSLSREENFVQMLQNESIADELVELSSALIESLTATFGNDGTDHPLFQRLNIDEALYQQLGAIVKKRHQSGDSGLSPEDYALILTVPFAFSAEQFGPAFSDEFKERILEIRKNKSLKMLEALDGLFVKLDQNSYLPSLTLMDNAIFGRISSMEGSRKRLIEDVVVDVLRENGLRRQAAQSIYDLVTTRGGDNLPTVFRERLAFSRAGIKKPDILILGNAIASHNAEARAAMRERIRNLMPDTTMIFIEREFSNPDNYDMFVEIVDGRIVKTEKTDDESDTPERKDLNRKIEVIARTELFNGLNRQQQRLLAFSAQWYPVSANERIFNAGDAADAAYLCYSGEAALYWPATSETGQRQLLTPVLPGRLIGDLSVIQNTTRLHELIASEDSVFLRIGKPELKSVIENDVVVATNLLRTVAGHLNGAASRSRKIRNYAIDRGVDFSDFEESDSR